MTTLIIVAVFIAAAFAAYMYVIKLGMKLHDAEIKEDVFDDIHTVKNARDLIARNKSMRDKLRGKYKRP